MSCGWVVVNAEDDLTGSRGGQVRSLNDSIKLLLLPLLLVVDDVVVGSCVMTFRQNGPCADSWWVAGVDYVKMHLLRLLATSRL